MVNSLMTRKQAARWANCSVWKIDELRESGALPYTKVGRMIRIDPDDLRRLFEPKYTLKSGQVLSEADCWDLAAEAERGYDVSRMRPRGGQAA